MEGVMWCVFFYFFFLSLGMKEDSWKIPFLLKYEHKHTQYVNNRKREIILSEWILTYCFIKNVYSFVVKWFLIMVLYFFYYFFLPYFLFICWIEKWWKDKRHGKWQIIIFLYLSLGRGVVLNIWIWLNEGFN